MKFLLLITSLLTGAVALAGDKAEYACEASAVEDYVKNNSLTIAKMYDENIEQYEDGFQILKTRCLTTDAEDYYVSSCTSQLAIPGATKTYLLMYKVLSEEVRDYSSRPITCSLNIYETKFLDKELVHED